MHPFGVGTVVGLSDTLSKGRINRSDDFSLFFMLSLVQAPIALIHLRLEKQNIAHSIKSTLSKVSVYWFALIAGLLNIVGAGLLWLSFSFTDARIASPITGTSGVLTIVFVHCFLKDKVTD